MTLFIVKKLKLKFNLKDKKLIFLLLINLIPLFLIFLTSLFFGINIRTMWMTPFYLFSGVLIIYLLQQNISLKKIKNFFAIFLFLFIISPILYYLNSVIKKDQRLDYPAKEISEEVQKKWEKHFKNDIKIVVGQSWWAGNLSYHLVSRPKYIRGYLNFVKEDLDSKDGTVYIGDKNMLNEICPGVLYKTNSLYICMVGDK
tara:strand:- start:1 stop:600 length:600 start_codon:yes stop_codon:yes gene_type:complete